MKAKKNSTMLKLVRPSQVKILALAAGLMAPASATFAQSFYTNSTGDFNVAVSWSPNGVPSGNGNATDDNGSNNVVLIQPADPAWGHGDTLAGQTAGTSGAYLQTGSTNNTGYPSFGNWLRLGIGTGSTGYYVLSNGVVNVAGRTQIGEKGTGYLEIDNGVYNTGYNGNPGIVAGNGDFGISTGTMVLNGGAVTNVNNETWFGEGNGCTGYLFMNGGTFKVNNWFVFGRNGGTGFGTMTAGTLTLTGGGQFLVGGGGVGALAQSGGTINVFNQYLVPQSNGGGSGLGTNILSGSAVLNVHDWLAVGRNGGYGELDISGNATITRDNSSDGGSHFDIGASGTGIVNQNGGSVTESTSDLWLGESGAGTWNFNSGTALVQHVVMCVNSSASATLNLNGGLFQTAGFSSPTAGSTVSFLNLNGGTLQANANNASFISGLYQASIGAAGVTIDSQNYSLTVPQALIDNGGGTLTKVGSGTLTLSGANSYLGATVVSAGTLNTTTGSSTPGNVTVADNAGFGVAVQSAGGQYAAANVTLGSSTGAALSFDLGSFGNPSLSQAPLNVNAGSFTVKGTITVNVADALPQLGEFPLVQYLPGGLAGGGNFVLGSLPVGVMAVLVTNSSNNSIDLNITSVNQPRWDGEAGGTWDTGSDTNWVNIGTGLPTTYTDPSTVVFDDNALGTTTVNLTTTVHPLGVTAANNNLTYILVGTGKISGSGGVTMQGAGSLSILNTGGNNYTGPTTISGGTLTVTNLANGGAASAIGASSASPTNLVLNGGDLTYNGPAASINRGYLTEATNSGITVTADLTLSGQMAASPAGGLFKSGLAQITYTGAGSNALAGANSLGYILTDGSVTFDGSNGGQTNTVGGSRLGLAGVNSTAQVTVTNAVMNLAGNLDIGYVAGTTAALTLASNSTINVGSWLLIGDGAGATATLTMNSGTLNVPNGRLFLGSSPGTMTTFNMYGGTINKSGDYYAIVNGGWNGTGARTGVVNQVNGTINSSSEMWVGDGGGAGNQSLGIYNLSGGTLTVNNWFGVGRDGSTGIFNMTGGTLNKGVNGDMVIGRGGSSGTFTMSGGTINKDAVNPLIVGQGQGVGELDQSGGTITTAGEYWVGVDNGTIATNNISGTAQMTVHNWVTIGRNGHGVVNLTSGQFNSDTQPLIVGIWSGSDGIWNQSGGSLYVNQDIWIGQGGGATNSHGMLNLSGGTITNTGWIAVGREAGQGILNISGGTMVKAGVGNNISIAHNSGASGVVNISGTGNFTCLSGETWVGENGAPGAWNMNGGTANLLVVRLAENADAQGVMTLNGGTLTANEITTGNTGATQRELDFNGGTLRAGTSNPNFIHDLSAANVQSGGAIFDTAGQSVSINQALLGVGADGGLTKNGSGTLLLNGVNTYTNTTAVNAGALGGSGTILGRVTVAAGATLSAGTTAIGTLTISNTLAFTAGSTNVMKINLTTNDQVAGLTGVAYNGSLVVLNVSGSPLTVGQTYPLFSSATAGSGNFVSVTVLPSGAGTFNPATGLLTITGAGTAFKFSPVKMSGGNLVLTGSGGIPGSGYTVLTATNLTTPLSAWTTNTTGTMDGSGAFSNSVPVTSSQPAAFYRIRMP